MDYREELSEYEASQAYEKKVLALAESLITNGGISTDMAPLSATIGCCYSRLNERGGIYVVTPNQPGPEHEDLITNVLRNALLRYSPLSYWTQDNLFSTLHGLCKNDRWQKCLHTTEDTYNFAAALYLFTFCAREGYHQCLVTVMREEVVSVINAWTHASGDLAFETLPKVLFGDAWCDLFFSADDRNFVNVFDLIRNTQPPFVPGLIPAHLEPALSHLPDLD